LWHASSERFKEFDQWLLGFNALVPLDLAVEKAIELVGRERLQAALSDPEVKAILYRNMAFAQPLLRHFNKVPIVIFENQFMTGKPETPAQMYRILESQLGIRAVQRSG
jgi:hypothetical protein